MLDNSYRTFEFWDLIVQRSVIELLIMLGNVILHLYIHSIIFFIFSK